MTAEIGMRLTLRSFKHKNRKFSILLTMIAELAETYHFRNRFRQCGIKIFNVLMTGFSVQ